MKKIYLFDNDNIFAKMSWIGDRDDLPTNATCIEPPASAEYQSPKWDGRQWHLVADYTRHVLYNKATGEQASIDAAGALPEHLTLDPRPSEYHVWADGWMVPDNVQTELEGRQFEVAKAEKLQTLNLMAQDFIKDATEIDKVPDFEFTSWIIQAAEAKAWAGDKAADTPVLNQIAASRGINADKLKDAALRKTLAYERLSANIAGQRQALQSKIERATDMAALEAIEIVFTEPEAV